MKKIIFTTLVIVVTVLVFPTSSFAQVTFRSPINTGTVINNPFDNNPTVGIKKIYDCTVSNVTDQRDNHNGTDFPVPTGTPVIATAAGRVYQNESNCSDVGSLSSSCGFGFGNNYRLDHAADTADGRGLVSIYAHMKASSITIPVGTPVACSQQLGLSATSGHSTGPHLHFEIRTDGLNSLTAIDPYIGQCSHTTPPGWTSVSNGQPTTQCDNHPLAPSNVATSSPTTSSLVINFKDNALNETSIPIERKIGTSGSWVSVGSFGVLSGASSWTSTMSALSSGTTYCFRLRAQNGSLYSSTYSNEACGTTLNAPSLPLAPSNVTITNATTNSLQVNFKDNATNETSVLIERKTGTNGSWALFTNFGALTGTSNWYFTNTGLPSGTTYCYRLRAQNSNGYSAYSNESCGTTIQNNSSLPLAPSNVTITNTTTNSLRVNFKDNATNETNILLERKISTGGNWVSLGGFGILPGTDSWYWTNTGLSSRTMYCYRLRAQNNYGYSAYSSQACGTTP